MAKRKEKIEEKEKNYIILTSERYLVLEDMVCEKMDQGYTTVGGVTVVWGRNSETGFSVVNLYQAMKKSNLII